MTPLTDAELAAAKKACEEVSAEPWRCEIRMAPKSWTDEMVHYAQVTPISGSMLPADGRFIALSRTLLPRALTELKRLRAEREALLAVVRGAADLLVYVSEFPGACDDAPEDHLFAPLDNPLVQAALKGTP